MVFKRKPHSYVEEASKLNDQKRIRESMAVWNKGLQQYLNDLFKLMGKWSTKDVIIVMMVFQTVLEKLVADFPEQKKIADTMAEFVEVKIDTGFKEK